MENKITSRAYKFKMIVILIVAATLSLGFYFYRGNDVVINVDGKVIELLTFASTVEDVLVAQGVQFSEKSVINIPLDSQIENNIEIIIRNPKTYTIDYNGNLFETTSIYSTVEEILGDKEIVLGEKDFTYPELSEEVVDNTTIQVFRVTEKLVELESSIPFEEQVITNRDLDVGIMKVVEKGKEGLKKTYIKKEYVDDRLVSETIEREEIISEPINQVKEKGTKDFIMTSRGDTRFSKAITMTATAYDLSFESTGKNPGDRYYGITASGTKVRPGVVAVDPRVIPLGTKLYIKSLDGTKDYGFAIAEDKGGAIKGNKIDLFFESSTDVWNFGRRKVKVYILN